MANCRDVEKANRDRLGHTYRVDVARAKDIAPAGDMLRRPNEQLASLGKAMRDQVIDPIGEAAVALELVGAAERAEKDGLDILVAVPLVVIQSEEDAIAKRDAEPDCDDEREDDAPKDRRPPEETLKSPP